MKLTLPRGLADGRILARGALLRFTASFPSGPRDKYGVVVSNDPASDPIFLVLSTSQVAWYDSHRSATGFVRLAAHEIETLRKESVLVCRSLHRLEREVILAGYQRGEFEFCESLSPSMMRRVDAALAQAVTLSDAEKSAVAPLEQAAEADEAI